VNEKILMDRIGYRFKDAELLRTALNHSSYVNECRPVKSESNERLEFLGDAMLEGFISFELFKRLPFTEEGDLTKLRAHIVCEKSLFRCASAFSLGEFLNLGRGEELNGGRKRSSVVADAMEALIGAVYVDGGTEAATDFVVRVFAPIIDEATSGTVGPDYKSRLQEILQTGGPVSIHYEVDREEGPDHDKLFYVNVFNSGDMIGYGMGKSKKQAEQNAAKNALLGMKGALCVF
jgi:ribonuclease-3